MLLDKSTKSLEIALVGAIATINPNFAAEYEDRLRDTIVPILNLGVTNGVTQVPIVPAPADNTARVVRELLVYNADTANVIVLIRFNDGAGHVVKKTTLTPGQTLTYNPLLGWQVN